MNRAIFLVAILAIGTFVSIAGKKLHSENYTIDNSKSSLEWFATKVTGKHNGTINFSNGTIANTHGSLMGSFEIDMNSIVNTDIKDQKSKAKLEKHLKSEDFFNVAVYPKARFVITIVKPLSSPNSSGATHQIIGNLTIKDKTNEISFDALILMEADKMLCTGSAVIDRSKFDVRYGSKTFFENIGDKMIHDEFTLKFSVVAVKG